MEYLIKHGINILKNQLIKYEATSKLNVEEDEDY